eukprot:1184997-Pleurochrysis_carterae.AAC.1
MRVLRASSVVPLSPCVRVPRMPRTEPRGGSGRLSRSASRRRQRLRPSAAAAWGRRAGRPA